jgi:hypothetical protein
MEDKDVDVVERVTVIDAIEMCLEEEERLPK